MNNNQATLSKMNQMRLHGMARAFGNILETGMSHKFTIDELLSQLIDTEWDDSVDATYFYVSAGTDIANGWSIAGTLGHQDVDCDDCSYTHAQLDVTKSLGDMGDITLSVSKASENSGDDDFKPFISWSKGIDI